LGNWAKFYLGLYSTLPEISLPTIVSVKRILPSILKNNRWNNDGCGGTMSVRVMKNAQFADERLEGMDCLVMAEGRILQIGGGEDFKDLIEGEGDLIDLKGATVLPGFIDTHTHFLHTGLHMTMASLIDCASIDELIERLRNVARSSGEWLKAFGFDESFFTDGRLPTRHDLDHVDEKWPIVISRRDYHSCIVNSAALAMLAIPEDLDSAEVRDGFFKGRANDWIRQVISSRTGEMERREAFAAAAELALSKGITTVHALEGGSLFGTEDLEFYFGRSASCPLNVVLYPQITDIAWVKSKGLPRIGGCLLIDGSFGSRTAALSTPYADQEDAAGILYFSDEDLLCFIEEAHLAGLQLSFHAIGDRAIHQLVKAYEKTLAKHPKKDHRHRIEHCELPAKKDIESIARLELALGVQPTFESLWGGGEKMYFSRLGARAGRTNPLRELRSRGVLMGGGSDSDVTPMDPLLGIHAAVAHPTLEFRLTPREALALYTKEAARLSFQETEIGDLAPGMSADLAVLSRNPLRVSPDEIVDCEVLMTFVRGECVFNKKEGCLCRKSLR
jgi:predicted amidohydrolase YtcJ